MATTPTKWGIASAGKISHDFVNDLATYGENSGHSVVAVAARSLDTAKEFAAKHNIPKAYEGKAWFTWTAPARLRSRAMRLQ